MDAFEVLFIAGAGLNSSVDKLIAYLLTFYTFFHFGSKYGRAFWELRDCDSQCDYRGVQFVQRNREFSIGIHKWVDFLKDVKFDILLKFKN